MEAVEQRRGHLHPAGQHRHYTDAGRRMLRIQRAVQQQQAVVARLDMQLAALATETLIAQGGVQRIIQSGTALQQVAEHAEGAGSQVAPEQQAGFRVLQA